MAGGIYLEVDASELDAQTERLRQVLTPARVNQVMYGIFKRTGGHVRKILKEDLPKQYYVKAGDVGKAVKNPKLTGGGVGGTGCIIPVTDPRRSIGGYYVASGGARGWDSVHKRYRVKARIVKSGQSTLPQQMDSYGDQPPFRNLGPSLKRAKGISQAMYEQAKKTKSSLGKVAFTRAGGSRLPIMKVVGVSIAQMPKNRSEGEVQRDIKDYMMKRMAHELQRLIGG